MHEFISAILIILFKLITLTAHMSKRHVHRISREQPKDILCPLDVLSMTSGHLLDMCVVRENLLKYNYYCKYLQVQFYLKKSFILFTNFVKYTGCSKSPGPVEYFINYAL